MDSKTLAAVCGLVMTVAMLVPPAATSSGTWAMFTPIVATSDSWNPYRSLSNVTIDTSHMNASTLHLQNQSCSITVHFHGCPQVEDVYRSTIVTHFDNGSPPETDRKTITANSGRSKFDLNVLYQEAYWTNQDSCDMLYVVVVSNYEEKFKDVEKVTVKVDYVYNFQRDMMKFSFDVYLKQNLETHIEALGATTDAETTMPTSTSKVDDYVVFAVCVSIAILGTVVVVLTTALIFTCILLCSYRKRLSESDAVDEQLHTRYFAPLSVDSPSPLKDSVKNRDWDMKDFPKTVYEQEGYGTDYSASTPWKDTEITDLDRSPIPYEQDDSSANSSNDDLMPQEMEKSSHNL